MKLKDVKKLKTGDEVFWKDPDQGKCSRVYTIQFISFDARLERNPIIHIEDKDGSSLECFAQELS